MLFKYEQCRVSGHWHKTALLAEILSFRVSNAFRIKQMLGACRGSGSVMAGMQGTLNLNYKNNVILILKKTLWQEKSVLPVISTLKKQNLFSSPAYCLPMLGWLPPSPRDSLLWMDVVFLPSHVSVKLISRETEWIKHFWFNLVYVQPSAAHFVSGRQKRLENRTLLYK